MRTQRILGVVAFGLAAVVLAAAVLLVAGLRGTTLGAPFTHPRLGPITGPPHTIHQVAPLAPGGVVTVSAPLGDVSVATVRTGHAVRLTARLYHGERVVMHPTGGTLSVRLLGVGGSLSHSTSLCLIFCSTSSSSWSLTEGLGAVGADNIHIWITMPADSTIETQIGVGTLVMSGQYASVSAVSQAGSVSATQVTASTMDLTSQAGRIAVTDATGIQHLTLAAQAASITYEGTIGASTRVTAQAGIVRLRVDPTEQVATTVTVTAAAFSSSFAHLSGGAFGTFHGFIGRGGPGGVLTVTAEAGAVSIQPWAPPASGAR